MGAISCHKSLKYLNLPDHTGQAAAVLNAFRSVRLRSRLGFSQKLLDLSTSVWVNGSRPSEGVLSFHPCNLHGSKWGQWSDHCRRPLNVALGVKGFGLFPSFPPKDGVCLINPGLKWTLCNQPFRIYLFEITIRNLPSELLKQLSSAFALVRVQCDAHHNARWPSRTLVPFKCPEWLMESSTVPVILINVKHLSLKRGWNVKTDTSIQLLACLCKKNKKILLMFHVSLCLG